MEPRIHKLFKWIFKSPEIREFVLLGIAILSVISIGTTGYMIIEGWNFFDSLYMTVITLASIGYQEVHPLSQTGRGFTILLIIMGVGVVSVVLTTVAHKVIQQEFNWLFTQRRMGRIIKRMENHSIICGYGRLSRIAAKELKEAGAPLVIVDANETRCNEAQEAGHVVVKGDASTSEVLLEAGIMKASRLVSLLPKDADNLYVILTSKELNPNLFILSRAEDEAGEKRLKTIGANKIVSPYRVGAQKIADGLLRPYVTDFIDLAVSTSSGHLAIEEIRIPENSPLGGVSLKDAELRNKTNVMVAAIISPLGAMNVNPSGDTIIEVGSTLIGFGLKHDFRELERVLLGDSNK